MMDRIRHQLILACLLVLGTVALASAQGEQPGQENDYLPLHAPLSHMISGEWEPLTIEEVDPSEVPVVSQSLPGSDSCTAAPLFNVPGGTQAVTNDNTISAGDPQLACMWGNPGSPQGYRTTWFKFNSAFSGRVIISTAGSTYDTVLAVYSGGCAAPTQLACNDDFNYFSSQVSVFVFANQDYYVEVADWHLGVSGTATANVSAVINKETNWEIDNLMSLPRSRHAVAVVHDQIYVISGQTVAAGNPVRTPRVDRYNTTTGIWTQMVSMPAGSDGLGYSNTSAAEVGANIYLPSGYVGDDSIYDGTHWVYSIAGNTWFTARSNDHWGGNTPAIYHEALTYTGGTFDRYYVVGGLTGPLPLTTPNTSWRARAEVSFYTPASDSWNAVQQMGTGRFSHTAAIQQIQGKDYLCVVGGIGQNGNSPELITDGECLDIDQGVWDSNLIGPLNYPRYNAGSAVAPNGDWYVFGGTNNIGESVAITERYDRASNNWIALDSRFNLGSEDPNELLRPARAWPRGGFVGQTLWVVGGHRNTAFGDLVINLVEKLFLPEVSVYLPIIRHESIPGETDDTFETARRIIVGQTLFGNFYTPDDYVDIYYFDLSIPYNFTAHLSNMQVGTDYNMAVYRSNKVFLNESTMIGAADEVISGTLSPGRYFLIIERITPPPGSDPLPGAPPYKLTLE